MKRKIVLSAVVIVVVLGVLAAFFVPITVGDKASAAKPGSPAYTEALTSDALPPLPPKFGGVVKPVQGDSTPWWPATVVPPKGAPNVLLILTDDVGFGAPSTFGGVIPTPALDRIAAAGLRYTRFHTTALCSPTRAALITGRNHHSVGFGVISEMSTGYPGYDSIIGRDSATIGTILRENGYATSWFGKNHNTPPFQASQAGPFDQWPVGMGFEYFYGFVGGDTSQWQPWDKANAAAPSKRKTQYFEMLAMRGIYHEGWMASTTPPFVPWAAFEGLPQKAPKDLVNGYTWELYKLDDDPTQADDIARKHPEKLAELKKVFMAEAAKYNVLPLDNRSLSRFILPKPSATGKRTVFTYTGEISNIPKGGAPSVLDRGYTITAEVDIPAGGADGMLVTDGGRFGGYSLYVLKGKPVFVYNYVNVERFRWEAKDALAPGKHTVVFDFAYDGIGFGLGGKGTLKVNGKVVDARRIPKTLPFMFPEDETFDVGVDTRTPIDDRDYQVPFRFQGKLARLTVELHPLSGTLAQILEFKWATRD